jgi:hypothetical protein
MQQQKIENAAINNRECSNKKLEKRTEQEIIKNVAINI